jgi:uncharacterized coiled-coil DUF342 family protein
MELNGQSLNRRISPSELTGIYLELEPQAKRTIREVLNATIVKLCHKYREPAESSANFTDLQNEARQAFERIMQRTDAFLEDEKVALRSEEFLVFLFDDFYNRLKDLGVISSIALNANHEDLD